MTVTTTPSIPASLAQPLELIEADLASRLTRLDMPADLADAVRYAVLGGGKRLRPLLVVACCQACGGRADDALPAACAMELIHTFSLVHDDLPAMDDDDLRRGRKTLHIHASEAMAILAGDAMTSLAFTWIAESTLAPSLRSEIAAELARATTAMIAGQVYDTLGGFQLRLTDRQKLDIIHHHKTGALIRASCRMGGLCAAADPHKLAALTAYGESVGLMFQIVDDVLDVTQSSDHLGKASGKDAQAGKLTFPAVLGLEGSLAEIRRLQQASHQALAPLGNAGQPLLELCDFLAVRTR